MGGIGITIKRIEAADVDAFRRIRLEALRSEPSFYASSYEDWAALSVEEWKQRLNDPVFVAFQDDEPVGIIGLLRQRASKMAHRATIIMVYVCKSLRGTGLAGNLLGAATDYARDLGILQLELAVTAENPAAIRFYQREGFIEVGRIPGGFLHDGREIDDVMMVRRLICQPIG
ncbi:N-acetyltransferase family protein [Agrobacterium fabrum]|jgi:RimJ/RimL family protein N-acetyltransferase|uniref:L-amino acid N-acyltransferase YncA n=1 Tax=Agrobacterium fabrum TaxID=1176649 RepID=A0A7Z7FSR5_9HYPH|nr:GNAT family N-acetyltransferase [Agrobacterium fabrum]WIE29200.1 GNAT family N-acetyltransferase [Agrobacterium fabrum]WIE45160.1 GNAT family N-acetyltransferase [Agrobacterium fabrum]SDJ97272.1 L-amino acid N-acyltransferase YncA [Agrobacterium fabrum]